MALLGVELVSIAIVQVHGWPFDALGNNLSGKAAVDPYSCTVLYCSTLDHLSYRVPVEYCLRPIMVL